MLGGKCVFCGTSENLHFDHLNPKNKEFTIAKILTFPMEVIEKEVKKCQLLCATCHKKKTLEKQEFGKLAPCGTMWRYKHYGCRCDKCRKARSDYYHAHKPIKLN